MKKITIGEIDYNFKTSIEDINVGEYFDVMKIISERCEKVLSEADVLYYGQDYKEYYERGKEPESFLIDRTIKLVSYLSKIPRNLFDDYPQLIETLSPLIENFDDNSEVLNRLPLLVNKGKKLVESEDTEWLIDKPTDWCFQQWVDCENATKQGMYYPFIISIRKVSKGKTSKKVYDRSHPDLDYKLSYWLKKSAKGLINTILSVIDSMSETRTQFFWVYEATSQFPDTKENKYGKIYSEFAGWNDVVVSMSQTPVFNSSKGTLYAVRNANCLDVLEYLNWQRGKSYAEYEDYKSDEAKNNKMTIL